MARDGEPETERIREETLVRKDPRTARRQEGEASQGQPLRGPRAPRAAAALGPAARARRRPGLLGPAQGGAAGPEGEPARRPHGGPPARVPRVRGADPEG